MLGWLLGTAGIILGMVACAFIFILGFARERLLETGKVKRNPMRIVAWLSIVLGLSIMVLTIPIVGAENVSRGEVYGRRLQANPQLVHQLPMPRSASPWPGLIVGAAIIGFGVLLLAIRRPQGHAVDGSA